MELAVEIVEVDRNTCHLSADCLMEFVANRYHRFERSPVNKKITITIFVYQK